LYSTDSRIFTLPIARPDLVWVVLAGWWIALTHLVSGVALCITIIGIPFGIANFKLIPVALLPLGKQIVDLP